MSECAPKHPNPSEPTGAQHGDLIPDNERPHLTIEQPSTQAGRASAQIEVFTGAVRMTGASFQIEVAGADFTYQATGDRTVFTGTGPDQTRLLFGVRSDGAVLFRADPPDPPAPQTGEGAPNRGEGPQQLPTPAGQPHPSAEGIPAPQPRPPASEPVDQQPATPAGPRQRRPSPDTPAPGPADQPATEAEAERVQLTGRLGRDPTFRTTKDTGIRIARFPLAVHAEDGTTHWHTVLAFGDRAKQLERRTQAGELAQGREVDVVGYLHTTTRPGRNGRPRQVQEIYAVAVKKR